MHVLEVDSLEIGVRDFFGRQLLHQPAFAHDADTRAVQTAVISTVDVSTAIA